MGGGGVPPAAQSGSPPGSLNSESQLLGIASSSHSLSPVAGISLPGHGGKRTTETGQGGGAGDELETDSVFEVRRVSVRIGVRISVRISVRIGGLV